MKRKMYVVITDVLDFAKGDFQFSVSLMGKPTGVASWINVCEVEIDFSSVDMVKLNKMALAEIDETIKTTKETFHSAMGFLERKRSELMALPAPTEIDADA